MAQESGTKDCYALLQAKRNLEEALQIITNLRHADHIKKQLVAVHNQLEGMHELKRRVLKAKKVTIK